MSQGPSGGTSSGMAPNMAAALSYVLGLITGVIFFVIEKENDFVRFHAMQSILFNVAYIVIWIVLTVVGGILSAISSALICVTGIINLILALGALVLWVILIMKAYQGQRYHLPYIGEMAEKYSKGS